MKNKKELYLLIFISTILTFLLFWQFFLKGLHPFPGDYMTVWYEPWKSNNSLNGVITLPHKPVADDVFRQLYPFKVLAMETLRNFELPLWNPYNGAGMPLFATMHSGFLNPFNIFFLIFPGPTGWSLYIIAQAILLVTSMYLYCRRLSLGIASSLFSAVTFLFSGFVIVRLIFGEYIYVIAMLPLILYFIESFLLSGRKKYLYFLTPTILFTMISGHPHAIMYVVLVSFLYILYRTFQIKELDKILWLGLFITLGIGLSAIQLIPTIELYLNSSVNHDTSKFIFERFLLPNYHVVNLIVPNYFGNQSTYNYWGAGDYIESIAAIGSLPCFFALLAFVKENKKRIILFFTGIAIFSILLTIKWLGSELLYSLHIPILSTGVPSRIFVLTAFSISILAGYGFQNILQTKKITTDYRYITGIFLVCMLGIILITTWNFIKEIPCTNQIILDCRTIAFRNTVLEFAVFTIGFSLCLWYIWRKNKIIPFILVLLITISGLYNAWKFLPYSPSERIMPSHTVIDTIKNIPDDFRIMGMSEANIKTNFATYYKFYDPNYYDPLYNRRYGELISYANKKSFSQISRSDVEITNDIILSSENEQRRNRLFQLLSVKYLIFKKSQINETSNQANIFWQDDTWHIEKNESILPRVSFLNQYEVIADQKKILEKLFDSKFDPKNQVILEKKPLLNFAINNNSSASIKMLQYNANNILLKYSSSENKLLLLSDNYFPGWKAFIDNEETQIYRANYSFRSIEVPSGSHTIRFQYDPLSLKYGVTLSTFSFILYILIILWPKISGKKNH